MAGTTLLLLSGGSEEPVGLLYVSECIITIQTGIVSFIVQDELKNFKSIKDHTQPVLEHFGLASTEWHHHMPSALFFFYFIFIKLKDSLPLQCI